MQLGSTVQLDSHAVAMLRHIRASMDAAVSLAVPGSAVIAAGVVGLLAAATSSIPSLQAHWLAIWLFAAVIAASLGGALMTRQISLRGLAIADAPIRKFAIGFLPSLFAGAILTAALGFQGNLHIIPAMWLLLYGCALMAASAVTVRTIGFLGASFALLGVITFVLPASLHVLMLGLGFGGLHILFGFLLGRMGHGRQA
jgi:hypothetical protein